MFLFGSRARGDNHPGSDVDAFIDIDPGRKFSLLDLIGLEHAIERKTGLQVDLTTRSSLHPALRESIEAEAIRIF
ncbi:MAG: nucleotidyltransferase family protein [Hyphomicrobium sp.]